MRTKRRRTCPSPPAPWSLAAARLAPLLALTAVSCASLVRRALPAVPEQGPVAAFAEARYYAAHGGDYALGGVAVIGRATSGLLSPVFARGLTTYDHGRLLAEQLYSVVVHHTAGRADETVLSVQRFHMETRGWADIGYHFFIDGAGRVFEGRPLGYVGAHAGEGRNQGRVGVCVAGNFETGEPAPAQLAALWALLAALDDRFGGLDILLHREVRAEPTDCPGRFLAAEVERFRAGRKSKRP